MNKLLIFVVMVGTAWWCSGQTDVVEEMMVSKEVKQGILSSVPILGAIDHDLFFPGVAAIATPFQIFVEVDSLRELYACKDREMIWSMDVSKHAEDLLFVAVFDVDKMSSQVLAYDMSMYPPRRETLCTLPEMVSCQTTLSDAGVLFISGLKDGVWMVTSCAGDILYESDEAIVDLEFDRGRLLVCRERDVLSLGPELKSFLAVEQKTIRGLESSNGMHYVVVDEDLIVFDEDEQSVNELVLGGVKGIAVAGGVPSILDKKGQIRVILKDK